MPKIDTPDREKFPPMRRLAMAIEKKRRAEKAFSGTSYAVAELMHGVSHQQLINLLTGNTPPWFVRVVTMQEICRVFQGDIVPADFYRPESRGMAAQVAAREAAAQAAPA